MCSRPSLASPGEMRWHTSGSAASHCVGGSTAWVPLGASTVPLQRLLGVTFTGVTCVCLGVLTVKKDLQVESARPRAFCSPNTPREPSRARVLNKFHREPGRGVRLLPRYGALLVVGVLSGSECL